MSKKHKKYEPTVQTAKAGLDAKNTKIASQDGFVIGMAMPPTVQSIMQAGGNPRDHGVVLSGAEKQLVESVASKAPAQSASSGAPSASNGKVFRFPEHKVDTASGAKPRPINMSAVEIDMEIDREMSKMQDIIEDGKADAHLKSFPGGHELKAFIDENLSDISREVTFITCMPGQGIDPEWTSRVQIWVKDREAKEGEHKWMFSRALMADPCLQIDAAEELDMAMNMKLAKMCETDEYCEGAVTVWLTTMPSKNAFFFWIRHALGASVSGLVMADTDTGQFLINGERGCSLLAQKIILEKSGGAKVKWEEMCSKYLEMAGRVRLPEVKEALKAIGFEGELADSDATSLMRAMMPKEELARFLSTSSSLTGNDLVTELHTQNSRFVESIDGLVEEFHKDLAEEKKAHETSREREKKRFLKDMESREKFNKGVTDRANRLDAEARVLRAEIEKLKKAGNQTGVASAAIETASGPSRLLRALDEVFA
jgi:hypothetical protein